MPPPPPRDIRLSSAKSGQLTFTWEPTSQHCHSLHYLINASGCGVCPNSTTSHAVTCHLPQHYHGSQQTCSFSVQAVVCGNVAGRHSTAVQFNMTGWLFCSFCYHSLLIFIIFIIVPDAPIVSVLPEYSGESSKLLRLLVQVNVLVSV